MLDYVNRSLDVYILYGPLIRVEVGIGRFFDQLSNLFTVLNTILGLLHVPITYTRVMKENLIAIHFNRVSLNLSTHLFIM